MSIDAISGRHHSYDRSFTDAGSAVAGEEASDGGSAGDELGMRELFLEGDINAQVAALAIRSAQEQREANRAIQVAEEAALERAEQQQVEALHRQAADIRMAGLVEGASSAASGALTIRGSLAKTPDGAPDLNAKDRFSGWATISGGGGKALAGLYGAAKVDEEANAKMHEHQAGHHRRNFDAARDATREAQDLLERALDFYKQSQQTAADAASTSVRRA